MCRSYMTLGNETVAMFHLLTEEMMEPFLRPVSDYCTYTFIHLLSNTWAIIIISVYIVHVNIIIKQVDLTSTCVHLPIRDMLKL